MFVYFCRGLSENMERRPTCHVYNEIITCCAIFLNLEESRSHGNERETGRARGQGARPPPLGACPGLGANQVQLHGLCSTDLKDQGKPCDQCRFDPTAQIHLRGLYKQGLSEEAIKVRVLELLSHRELELAIPNSFKFYRID